MANFIENYKKKKAEEKADWNHRNPENLPTKMQTICRIIVGAYLLYIVYKMIADGALKENTGWSLVLMIAAMVLFVVAGVYFGIKGIKAYRRGEFFDPNKDDFSEEGKAAAAEAMEAEANEADEAAQTGPSVSDGAVRPGSMAAFARLSAAAAVSEEEQDAAYEEAKEANEQIEESESYTE